MTQCEHLYRSISLLSQLNAFWVEKLGFLTKKFNIFDVPYFFDFNEHKHKSPFMQCIFIMLECFFFHFFLKNLAFHKKTLTFLNFHNYWISVISFAAYVVSGVLCYRKTFFNFINYWFSCFSFAVYVVP